ncbi:gamma-glutamyltransferase family protein [Donghicola sp.]|jgi:gamma-glutamyltranspeptidase/glutathione hydrolase|uniref:gamma-glutamyltransferase family protein n=1 Tax=Donghicola sp. TaxID=1929294 RepID=UPI0025F68ADB|nr:gamma-glutamyltransferase family protein [Donghicola sp.]MCT4578447.1 gamma-glutamyltransferase family protein [Donghicola sp.]
MRDFHQPGRSMVIAANGMCATSHPIAAQTAISTLQAGGNAMDAALSAAVLLGIAEPQMTGIGGDCFVLFKPSGSEDVLALNGSGRAPAGASAAAFRERGLSTVPTEGADPVTIPTAMDAFCRLNADWGRMTLGDVLAPAIRYADDGIPIAPRVAFDLAKDAPRLSESGRRHYLINGEPPRAGQIFRAPGQAEVLRKVAQQGRDGFYTGEVAEDMVNTLRAAGGCHTLDDFANAEANYTTPISSAYQGIELLEHPPNGHGATAMLMLNILSKFDLPSMGLLSADRAHVEAEAAKLAYDTRNRVIADPDHCARLDHMLSIKTADKLGALIQMDQALPMPAPSAEAIHKDTIYITVVDKDRMAVSLIYSIFHGFGSGLASDKFGILLQNRGAGFTLEEGHPNELAPGKRPLHTIIPGMLRRNGKVLMPFGVMGGAYQPNGHTRLITNLHDFGLDVQEALDAPRSFADGQTMQVERGYSEEVRADLAQRGHNVVVPETPLGGGQAIILREDGLLEAGSDPRKDGCALGY